MNRMTLRAPSDKVLGRTLLHHDLRERVIDAFTACPDALHGQALTTLEAIQILELHPNALLPPDMHDLYLEWSQMTDLPAVVREVWELIRNLLLWSA